MKDVVEGSGPEVEATLAPRFVIDGGAFGVGDGEGADVESFDVGEAARRAVAAAEDLGVEGLDRFLLGWIEGLLAHRDRHDW